MKPNGVYPERWRRIALFRVLPAIQHITTIITNSAPININKEARQMPGFKFFFII